jgi:hypothetical protein
MLLHKCVYIFFATEFNLKKIAIKYFIIVY